MVNEIVAKIVKKCLNEQNNVQDLKSYLGDTFNIQDATAEETVGRNKGAWGNGQVFREIIENAGDILRELSSRANKPDVRYIEEKTTKIRYWLKKDFTEIPTDIITLEEFNDTVLKWSDAIDGREYVLRFHGEILNQTIKEYENIPVYSNETKIAKDLVLTILRGKTTETNVKLKLIDQICEQIKQNGYLTFTAI